MKTDGACSVKKCRWGGRKEVALVGSRLKPKQKRDETVGVIPNRVVEVRTHCGISL